MQKYWENDYCKNAIISLHDSSIDDSICSKKIYMVNSLNQVINFDRVKTNYLNSLGCSEDWANSVDALVKNKKNGDYYFIEFKNGTIDSENIKNKVLHSVLIFNDIYKCNLSEDRDRINFYLVYNEKKHKMNPQQKRAMIYARKGNNDFAIFGLGKLRGYIFKGVDMMTSIEFEKWIDKNSDNLFFVS